MKKSHQKKHNFSYDDFEKPHHQAKQLKQQDEKKKTKRIERVIKSKNVYTIYELDESY